MADIWMDVDTALAEVPVNLMPLLDDTTFKAIQGAVAYNAAGMALRWHFVTCAGAYTVYSVTPTTGGAHDWTDQGDSGVYTIEIPASGGTINNDTEGFGWFTGVATGILPWRGPVIGFRAAGLNDLLIESAYSTTRGLAGTALPAAAADAAGGLPISDAGGLDLDAQVVTKINSILDDTGTSGVLVSSGTGAGQVSLSSGLVRLSATAVDDILDEVVEGSYTFRQFLRLLGAALGGKASGLGTTTATYRNASDSANAIVATVDSDGNRTAVTLTLT